MVKTSFSNANGTKTVISNYNSIIRFTIQVNTIIEKINNTTNETLLRMLVRKLYLLITTSHIPPDIMKLCNQLLNVIKKYILINAGIPKTVIYCMIVPN